jgi:hypothetical protein
MQGKYNTTTILELMRQLASSLDRLFPGKRSLLIAACQRNNGIITRIITWPLSLKNLPDFPSEFLSGKIYVLPH